MCMKCVLSHFSRVQLFVSLWTVAHQAPLSMGFSRQEYWSGVPCPPPGGLPPGLFISCTAGGFFTTRVTGEAHHSTYRNGNIQRDDDEDMMVTGYSSFTHSGKGNMKRNLILEMKGGTVQQ